MICVFRQTFIEFLSSFVKFLVCVWEFCSRFFSCFRYSSLFGAIFLVYSFILSLFFRLNLFYVHWTFDSFFFPRCVMVAVDVLLYSFLYFHSVFGKYSVKINCSLSVFRLRPLSCLLPWSFFINFSCARRSRFFVPFGCICFSFYLSLVFMISFAFCAPKQRRIEWLIYLNVHKWATVINGKRWNETCGARMHEIVVMLYADLSILSLRISRKLRRQNLMSRRF